MTSVATQEHVFDPAPYDLPVPKDRYGRKADRLTVNLGAVELDRTSEDDLDVFNSLEKGRYVELRVRAFVTQATDVSKTNEDGEDEVEIKRGLKVLSVEAL